MGIKALDAEANENQESYRIVTMNASDIPTDMMPLVLAPFLNSLRYGNDYFKFIDQNSYYHTYKRFITEVLLKRPGAKLRLAKLNDETVLGWCLFENKTLHYVWVKDEQRRQGIGKSIVPAFDTFTHLTRRGMSIWASRFKDAIFNPFI